MALNLQRIWRWVIQNVVDLYNVTLGRVLGGGKEHENTQEQTGHESPNSQIGEPQLRDTHTTHTRRRRRHQSLEGIHEEFSDVDSDVTQSEYFSAYQSPLATTSGLSTPSSAQPSPIPSAQQSHATASTRNQQYSLFADWASICIGVYAFSGSCFISAPYALKEGGWISYILLLAIAVVSYSNAKKLGACFNTERREYEEVVEVAYPGVGHRLCVVLLTTLSYATSVGTLMVIKENLVHVSTTNIGFFLTLMVLVILLIILYMFTITEENPYIPALGVFFMLVAVLFLIIIGATSEVRFGDAKTVLLNKTEWHISFGFYAYFYSGHACLPVVYASIKEKRNFRNVVISILVISTFLYGGIASAGYSLFGGDVKPSFTTNLPLSAKLSYIPIACSVINQAIGYILNMSSVIQKFDQLISEEWTNRHRYRLLMKTTLVLATALFVIVHSKGDQLYVQIISLVGAIIGVLLALVIPMLCFLRIHPTNLTQLRRRIIYMLLAFGVLGASFTVYQNIIGMI